MAKSKKQHNKQQTLSPEQYLKQQKARKLPIGKCYMSEGFQDCGEGLFLVSRTHTNGKISMATFVVDTYCLGVKHSSYSLWNDPEDLEEIITKYPLLKECSYEELHNWIYGAIEFAEEGGIAPDLSFNLTQYMLEEDTDDIPLIEYEYGKKGQHFLFCNSVSEANRYIPVLKEHLGDDFNYIIEDGKYLDDIANLDEETIRKRLENIKDSPLFKSYGPKTKYTYQHPEYPDTLQLTTPDWFYEELHKSINEVALSEDLVNRILQLPYDLVRENLEKIILYHIGKTCDKLPKDYESDGSSGIVGNAAILLGEVGNETSSLDVMLELLRQNRYFNDFHFGDAGIEILCPTLYLLGQNRLNYLLDFIKEEGLDTFSKSRVFSAVTQIALHQPERRAEILEWYRQVLRFATKMLPETQWFDNVLAGLLLSNLIDIQAKELLPYIKKMFETELVDLGICGDYSQVSRYIIDPRHAGHAEECILDVRKRFADMKRRWEH